MDGPQYPGMQHPELFRRSKTRKHGEREQRELGKEENPQRTFVTIKSNVYDGRTSHNRSYWTLSRSRECKGPC